MNLEMEELTLEQKRAAVKLFNEYWEDELNGSSV